MVLRSPPSVGWCVGQIIQRNKDARSFKVFEEQRVKVNFLIHYEIDQQIVKTALRLDEYDGEEDAAWVLLDAGAADERLTTVETQCTNT